MCVCVCLCVSVCMSVCVYVCVCVLTLMSGSLYAALLYSLHTAELLSETKELQRSIEPDNCALH